MRIIADVPYLDVQTAGAFKVFTENSLYDLNSPNPDGFRQLRRFSRMGGRVWADETVVKILGCGPYIDHNTQNKYPGMVMTGLSMLVQPKDGKLTMTEPVIAIFKV